MTHSGDEAAIPREIKSSCPTCSTPAAATALNPAYFRNLRERAGISQTEAAGACGISMSYLSRMELGVPGYPYQMRTAVLLERYVARRRKAGVNVW